MEHEHVYDDEQICCSWNSLQCKVPFGVVVPQGHRAIVVFGMPLWKVLGLPTNGY